MLLIFRALRHSVSILEQQGVEVLLTDLKNGKVTLLELFIESFYHVVEGQLQQYRRELTNPTHFPNIILSGHKGCPELGPEATWPSSFL